MVIQNYSLASLTLNPASYTSAAQDALAKSENVSAVLISLCTSDWIEFFASKEKLGNFPTALVRAEASRLLMKNSRSFKLLSIVFHPVFFSDWEAEESKNQVSLFSSLAAHSLNHAIKEAAFHRAAGAIRKAELLQPNLYKPTKLRLRDCHRSIAMFISEYAAMSAAHREIALKALAEGERSGCGHLPSQQAVALMKKLADRKSHY